MLIKNDFEVAEPADDVWRFFDDIPQVAACLPGAELTEQLGENSFAGRVAIRLGPVKLEFGGTATITERDDDARRIVVDAAGADVKGRGQAAMLLTATVAATPQGSRVEVAQDLKLSGAAAQYGRGMIGDVTSVLMGDFATNMQSRLSAIRQGLSPDQAATAKPASGLVIGLRAVRWPWRVVFRRFFLPYQPTTT
jgi:uncharacterized protein